MANPPSPPERDAPQRGAPPSAVDAVDWVRLDFIAEAMDFAVSYSTSAREAARRGNRELLKLHTDQAKKAVDAALDVEAELGSLDTAPA